MERYKSSAKYKITYAKLMVLSAQIPRLRLPIVLHGEGTPSKVVHAQMIRLRVKNCLDLGSSCVDKDAVEQWDQ